MEFQIKCHLGYELSGPASFLFNVAIAQNPFQRIITEHFEVRGVEYSQEMTIDGQRYHRVTAQGGQVELVYEAVVDATHEVFGDPSRLQVPLFEQIPAEALVFIYPSRFCQSDLLARLAKREFNQDESGFHRVTRICNWISERIEYLSGTTTPTTSAFDTVTQFSRCVQGFRASCDSLLPIIGNPSSVRERICLRPESAGLSRLYRSFSWGALDSVRPYTPGSAIELRANWTG